MNEAQLWSCCTLILTSCLVAACSQPSPQSLSCESGIEQSCSCPSGLEGMQGCDPSGTWKECACDALPEQEETPDDSTPDEPVDETPTDETSTDETPTDETSTDGESGEDDSPNGTDDSETPDSPCPNGPTNACEGCAELVGTPGETCGTCNTGVFNCDPENNDNLVCTGDAGALALNVCGGCEPLELLLGQLCGTCDSGVWECEDANGFHCKGDLGDNAFNVCGGCEALSPAVGDGCGPCGLDALVCDGLNNTVCPSQTFGNECGGCDELENPPGTPCGDCPEGAYACGEHGVTVCEDAICACGDEEGARFWRVLQNSGDVDNWFLAELEFHAFEANSSDLTNPGAAQSQASAGRFPERAYLAFDNIDNPGNSWGLWYTAECCTPVDIGTDWISWDFGDGNNKEIRRVRIRQWDHAPYYYDPLWSYESLKVQSSCDGESWSDEWVMDNLPLDGSWHESIRP